MVYVEVSQDYALNESHKAMKVGYPDTIERKISVEVSLTSSTHMKGIFSPPTELGDV